MRKSDEMDMYHRFIGCSIGKVDVSEVAKPLLPYLGVNFATVLLITYWPWLTMAIPGLLFKG